jgi:hypothetical protein
MIARMELRICACGCETPFEPVLPEQIYATDRCSAKIRMRRYRQRHKNKPRGGPPGRGTRLLFPKSELRRRKPAKSALKPKPRQDALFPDGEGLHVTFGGAAPIERDGSLSDNGSYNKYSVKSPASQKPEPSRAA